MPPSGKSRAGAYEWPSAPRPRPVFCTPGFPNSVPWLPATPQEKDSAEYGRGHRPIPPPRLRARPSAILTVSEGKIREPMMEKETSGKLRIGDHWNAITILALSQSNPLKAVAEFVENSIDAHSRHVTIVRGKEKGSSYLEIIDDGEGIPRDEEGLPNFKYVATHICDSIKRRLKGDGATGIQGEFGIGLLSFWTVGDMLLMTSPGADGKAYQMHMRKGDPNYRVQKRRGLFSQKGTELRVQPLLAGIKQLSGEKIQWYLSSELRDRIRTSGV